MTRGDVVRVGLSWLATYGLHSTLFLGGAWLLCRFRPPKLDRNRERLWRLGLVGGVLSATLQLALGARPPLGSFELHSLATAAHSSPPATPRANTGAALELASRPDTESAALRAAEATPVSGAAREAGSRPVETVQNGARRVEPAPTGRTRATHANLDSSSEAPRTPPGEPREVEGKTPTTDEGGEDRAAEASAPALSMAQTGETSAGPSLSSLGAHPGETSRASARRWPGLVLALWTVIGASSLTALLASWTCLRRRMLGREVLRDGPLLARFERLRERTRVRARVRLSVSSRIAAPFSTGLLRPEVCVPRAVLTELTGAQQDALLAHELAHLVRRDPAWFGIGFLIEKLFFFQPLNRLARRELSELAEVACDDWAVRWTGARLALASCLTEVAGWVIGEKPRLVTPLGLAGHRSRLAQRIQRLLDDRRSPAGEPPAPWWPPLAAGALALVTLAGPGVSAPEVSAARTESALPEPAQEALETGPLSRTALEQADPPAPAQPFGPVQPPGSEQPPGPGQLSAERSVLASELAMLERELAELHAELEAHALRERFQGALARIDARMAELRAQHRRVSELLALLETLNTLETRNTTAPAPHAETPLAEAQAELPERESP